MQSIGQSDLTVFNGDAVGLVGGAVRLTSFDREFTRGSVFSPNAINLQWDFSAKFSFRIQDNVRDGADGLTFALVGNGPSGQLGDDGGALGYGRRQRSGIANSIAIEYDTFLNSELNDPSKNHVGLNLNGEMGAAKRNDSLPIFDTGKIIYSWINYYSVSGRIDVFVSEKDDKNSAILALRDSIDIDSVIERSSAYAGFTASTGSERSSHDILQFQLLSYSGSTDPSQPGTVQPDPSQPGASIPSDGGPGGGSEADILTGSWKPKGRFKRSNKKPITATIWGSSTKSADLIDVTSVYADKNLVRDGIGAFGALTKKKTLAYQFKDFNKDGFKDLRLAFNQKDLKNTGAASTAELNLIGRYTDGNPFAVLAATPII